MGKRCRYRYICGGGITPNDKVRDFRLLSGNSKDLLRQLACRSPLFVRIAIPDDMVLHKCDCDCYSTTTDERTLEELNYDIIVLIDNKFVVRNGLKSKLKNNVISSVRPYLTNVEHLIQSDCGYLTLKTYERLHKPRGFIIN